MNINISDEDNKNFYKYLEEIGHKKIKALVNAKITYEDLNHFIKKQLFEEYLKKAKDEDLILFLLNKNFTNQQINQIIKTRNENKDFYKLLDTKISPDKMREQRNHGLENIDERT